MLGDHMKEAVVEGTAEAPMNSDALAWQGRNGAAEVWKHGIERERG